MAGEGTADIRVATPGESGRDHIIVSPFQFYVGGEDHLRLTTANSLTGVVLELSGRFFDMDTQKITPITEPHQPNSDRSIKQTIIRLGKGYVLNLAVRVVAGAPLIGQTFAIVELVRGFDGATQFLGVMSQGYVTKRQGLAWPGSPIQSSLEGGGYPRTLNGTQPAAGAEIAETVPTGARWILQSFSAPLATSATVAARAPQLQLMSGGQIVGLGVNANTVAASLTGLFSWAPGYLMSTYAGFLYYSSPIPKDMELMAGDTIQTLTGALQVGDQWGVPRYRVREYLEVAA